MYSLVFAGYNRSGVVVTRQDHLNLSEMLPEVRKQLPRINTIQIYEIIDQENNKYRKMFTFKGWDRE